MEKEEKSNGGREVVVQLYPTVVQAWDIPKILQLFERD